MTMVPTTLVLLDSTSQDGESALELLGAQDDHVALITMISGSTSAAIREYARSENTDVITAGWLYLDQVVTRVDATSREVQAVLADGPDIVREMRSIAAATVVRRVLLPSSLGSGAGRVRERLAEVLGAPVMIAGTVEVGAR